jgi:hypothetical protein
MSRAENSFKKYLMGIMGTRWDAQSHEDKYSSGIPDLSYGANGINGWIELKHIKSWKGDRPVKPDKYTVIQVNWLNKRQKCGGHCFIMIKIADDYYLLDAIKAKAVKSGMTKQQYETNSISHWHRSVSPQGLLCLLTQ